MEYFTTPNSEAIDKIIYVDENTLKLVYKKNITEYKYSCYKGHYWELKEFSKNCNGQGINRKINSDIELGKIIKIANYEQ